MIVGAGPAGLAVAGALARRRVRPVLLEAGEGVGWSWRNHYPFLRLHTTRRDSSLPGWPMPPGADTYPGRDEFVTYLERYAERIDADVRLRCPVRRVRRAGDGWAVETAGDDLRCRHVVVAAGFNRVPVRPTCPERRASADRCCTAPSGAAWASSTAGGCWWRASATPVPISSRS